MIRRVFLFGLLGAVAGTLSIVLAFFNDPQLVLEMGQDLPKAARGFYPPEHTRDLSFAWTSSQAGLLMPGFERSVEWTCAVRLRGGRAATRPQPLVQVAADGIVLARRTATNEYEDLAVTVPTRAKDGLLLTIASAPTFVPGPTDSRELGVQVQRVTCHPRGRFVLPPRRLIAAAMLSAAAFGAALGGLGLAGWTAAAGTLLVAAGQTIPLTSGFAPYSPYLGTVPWVAFWIAATGVLAAALVERWRRQPLHTSARLAIAFSAGALLLELLALLHPSKAVVDAVFHAHRLQWVLDGRYYFTQPMPDGVRFPYAIALYVVAAPWTYFTENYVALLKILVSAARAFAGLLLYPMVAKAWNDRSMAVVAVVLFHLVPLPFLVIGYANLTYAFGQSMAVATLVVLATYSFGPRAWLQTAGLFVVASVAFLSHVGIFPLLVAIAFAVAAFYRLFGGGELRSAAKRIALATALAAVFAVAVYYGHFPESYSTLRRVRGHDDTVAAPAPASPPSGSAAVGSTTALRSPAPPAKSRRERVQRAAVLAVDSFGWPVTILAVVGAVTLWIAGARDRLTLLAAACGLVYLGFVGISATAPIEPRFQRYSEEFISRVNFAVMPVGAVLAARGAVWIWRLNPVMRAAAIGLVAAAFVGASKVWLVWMG
jgi:hypothetical protein